MEVREWEKCWKGGKEEGIDGWGTKGQRRSGQLGHQEAPHLRRCQDGDEGLGRGWERQRTGTEQGWGPRMGLKEPGMGVEQGWGQKDGNGISMGTGGDKGWG